MFWLKLDHHAACLPACPTIYLRYPLNKGLSFCKTASPLLGSILPPIATVPSLFSWEPSGLVVVVSISLPSSTESKNEWSCTSAPLIRLQTMDRINFIVCFLLGNSHLHRPWKRQCTETSVYKIQTQGNYPEESTRRLQQGESLKWRFNFIFFTHRTGRRVPPTASLCSLPDPQK